MGGQILNVMIGIDFPAMDEHFHAAIPAGPRRKGRGHCYFVSGKFFLIPNGKNYCIHRNSSIHMQFVKHNRSNRLRHGYLRASEHRAMLIFFCLFSSRMRTNNNLTRCKLHLRRKSTQISSVSVINHFWFSTSGFRIIVLTSNQSLSRRIIESAG